MIKEDFTMNQVVLGIDISKLTFDVGLLIKNNTFSKKFNNNKTGYTKLLSWLKNHKASFVHACMEATGTYGEQLATFLYEKKFKISIVNPAQIKGFAQSELLRTKTDKLDAKLIARFCTAMSPQAWKPTPKHIRELQSLVKRLESLNSMKRQEENRLEVSDNSIKPFIKKSIKFFAKQIETIKNKITIHIDNNPDLKSKSKLLNSIPGIGEATISQILAFLSNVQDFKNAKQYAAFVGLNPKQKFSGTSVKSTKLSKIGDPRLRKAFYMPAIVAKQHNPILKQFCERLEAAGKHKMLIIGAAMRKLLHIIYGVLKTETEFNPKLCL